MLLKGIVNKKMFIGLLIFAMLIVAILYVGDAKYKYSNNNVDERLNSDASDLKSAHSVALDSVTTNNSTMLGGSKKPVKSTQIKTLAGTPAEAEVLQKWEESRGKFSEEALADYSSYDLDTLRRLAGSGDIKAMTALAHFYLSQKYAGEHAVDDAMQISKLAAAYGSTDLLKLYAILYATRKYQPNSQALNYEDLIEVLAWKNTAALRGDLYPNYDALSDIKNSGIQLNHDDKVKINQRSQEIYNELLTKRKSLGLGDFDNSRPQEVDKFFSYLENYMDEEK